MPYLQLKSLPGRRLQNRLFFRFSQTEADSESLFFVIRSRLLNFVNVFSSDLISTEKDLSAIWEQMDLTSLALRLSLLCYVLDLDSK